MFYAASDGSGGSNFHCTIRFFHHNSNAKHGQHNINKTYIHNVQLVATYQQIADLRDVLRGLATKLASPQQPTIHCIRLVLTDQVMNSDQSPDGRERSAARGFFQKSPIFQEPRPANSFRHWHGFKGLYSTQLPGIFP